MLRTKGRCIYPAPCTTSGIPSHLDNHTSSPITKDWHTPLHSRHICPYSRLHIPNAMGMYSCWQVTLPIYTIIQSKLWWHPPPFLSSSPHHSQTANISSQSVLPHHYHPVCCQTLSLFSQCQDGHWIQMIIMHMSIFETNYILSIPSIHNPVNSVPCSSNQLLTNHIPLETKYFLKVLLNHTYF